MYVDFAKTLNNARHLRSTMTDVERTLWAVLRNRGVCDAKFKRQAPVGSFIADFVCTDAMLIVELDGGQHAENIDADNRRSAWLERNGFKVVRFWNNDVLQNLEGVVAVIIENLEARSGGKK
jgi:very-short-patch-repair endonuclease